VKHPLFQKNDEALGNEFRISLQLKAPKVEEVEER
jgi:hypothetical protein